MSIRVSSFKSLLAGSIAALALSACGGASEQDQADGSNIGDSVSTDSGTFVLTQSNYTVSEDAGSLALVIRRTGGSRGTVEVAYETVEYDDSVNDRATAMGSGGTGDFRPMSGTLVFAAGETRKSVSVPVADDTEQEGDHVFGFRLTDVSRGKLGKPASAEVTIDDDDGQSGGGEPAAGSFRLSASSFDVSEGGGALQVTVNRVNGSDGAATVDYSTFDTGGAAAGSDYAATSGTLSFADGETQRSFSVGIIDDDAYTGDLTFGVALSNASSSIVSPSEATVIIGEDDPEPGPEGSFRLTASSYRVSETGGSVSFTVERVNGSSGAVSVDFATAVTGSGDGHAVPGDDFVGANGTLSFADGETQQSFSVSVVDDEEFTGSLTFAVRLSNAETSLSSPSEATVTISDDEDESTVSGDLRFSTAAYSVDEAGGSITLTVERVNGNTGEVAVDYATEALNTGNGDAVAGSDFQAASGTLVFADGVTERSFQVGIIDDGSYSGDLAFDVNLSNAETATVTPSSATVTILDDEPEPQDALTLVWDAPTTNADGSCLNDLDGFRLNYGLSSGNHTETISLSLDELTANPTGRTTSCGEVVAYEFPLDSLDSASWYITLQSRDASGNLSADSQEVVVTIQ